MKIGKIIADVCKYGSSKCQIFRAYITDVYNF